MTFSSALQLASMLGVMFVGAQCAALPAGTCPKIVVWYLWAQATFAFVGWIGTAHIGRFDRWYLIAYCATMIPALVLAVGLSCVALDWAGLGRLMLAEFLLCAIMGWQAGHKYGAGPWAYKLIMAVAVSFIASGLFLLLSLDKMGSPQWNSIRLILGLFLFSEGILHWMLPERIHVEREAAFSLSSWCPAFLAIGAFCWLGWSLAHAKVTP